MTKIWWEYLHRQHNAIDDAIAFANASEWEIVSFQSHPAIVDVIYRRVSANQLTPKQR